MSTEPSPSYYAIIPANIRYCTELEPGAKLLYGEITALAQKEGYCWATDGYFSSIYGINERTIQRWLKSLKEHKFVVIETTKNESGTERKIWISPEVQKFSRGGQKCRTGTTKMSDIILHIIIHLKKKRESARARTNPRKFF